MDEYKGYFIFNGFHPKYDANDQRHILIQNQGDLNHYAKLSNGMYITTEVYGCDYFEEGRVDFSKVTELRSRIREYIDSVCDDVYDNVINGLVDIINRSFNGLELRHDDDKVVSKEDFIKTVKSLTRIIEKLDEN